ncbi:MAG: hypothetical protein DHS20C16_35230 [Phycisphaerae bacterium]|nr:MAG: hypothetical protein DHS20C16_35230 [Phycisphaerae bacterium]
MDSDSNERPIHVAICIDSSVYSRYRAVLRHLCVGLSDLIAGIRIVTPTKEATALNLGPVQAVIHDEIRWPFRKQRTKEVIALLSSKPPTIIHAMSAGSYAISEALADAFDVEIIYQVTAFEDVFALAESQFTGVKHVICTSEPLREACLSQCRLPEVDVSLVRPGVVCAKEPTCYRVDGRVPTLLATASFTPDSGVDQLIRAIALVKGKNHEMLAFLLGDGPEEDQLRRVAAKLNLNSTVIFAQPEGDILQAMVGADIFVTPSAEKSISARSLQAMAQGMAVIAVEGGASDAYLADDTAVVARAATAPDLAGAIERLLIDRDFARQIATNAIRHMKDRHTMSAMADQTAEIYSKLALRRTTLRMPDSNAS